MKLRVPFLPDAGPWQIVQRFSANNFAPANPYKPWPGHQGVDYGLERGRVIYAIHGGVVTWAGLDPRSSPGVQAGYGWYVEITDAELIRSRSCHFLAGTVPPMVRAGATVQAGARLGQCNSTGFSRGDHLHLETHTKDPRYHTPGYVGSDGWGRFDPLPYLPASVGGHDQEFAADATGSVLAAIQERLFKLEEDRNLNYGKFIEAGAALGEALRGWNRVPIGALSDADRVLRTRLNATWSGRV